MRSSRTIIFSLFLFASFFVFSSGAFAADTCPGSDINNPYMCAPADQFTCDDQWGAQIRTINCYPPDSFVENDGTACPAPGEEEYFAYSGGCASTSYGSTYTCQPTDYFGCRYRYIDVGGCSNNWNLYDEYQFARVYCYPDTSYGAWEPTPCTSDAMCGVGYMCGTSGYCTEEMTCPNFGLERTTVYDLQEAAYAYGYAVATDDANNTYVTGEQYAPATGLDMYVIKYDSNGNVVWSDVYDVVTAGVSGNESGYGIAVLPNGSAVYVIGRQQDGASLDSKAFIRKYDSSGSVATSFGTGGTVVYNTGTIVRAAALDGSGNIYAAGYQGKAGGGIEAVLLSYDANGTLRTGFPVAYTAAYNASAYGIVVSGTAVYVTGYTQPTAVNTDMFVRSYTTGGGSAWAQTYNSGGDQTDIGYGVAIASTGDVYVTGYQNTNGGDIFYRKYTSGGLLIVGDSYNSGGSQNDVGRGIVTGNTRRIFIAGRQQVNSEDAYLGEFYALHTKILKNFLYRGDQAGAPEYGEMAFGVAAAPSSNSLYTSTANDIYVVGYQASNGGEAFLNKYSCNAGGTVSTGASMIAGFTRTPSIGVAPLTVSVDARASAGSITNYQWDWNYNGIPAEFNASSDTGSLTSHIYDTAGTYTIGLRVTSTGGAQDIASAVVTVNPNSPPTAAFKVCDLNNANCVPPAPAPFTGVAPLRVNVDGAASTDPDAAQGGYIASFSWDWGDGTVPGVGEKATHQYSATGLYTITLTVTDNGGLTNIITTTQSVSVIDQYVCAPACSLTPSTPVCGPTETVGTTQCYACLADKDCGAGYACLGAPCTAGTQCASGVACPADGRCPEVVTCNPLASGATCPDGSLCLADGLCPAIKNVCALSGSAVDTQCYVEEQGSCVINSDCTESITGGVCDTTTGACRYARCSNETGLACATDNDCAESDGICNGGACVYIYDCAYGPGLGSGVTGQYATSTPDTMPLMPLGVQPDGQACTQPTPDAPNNCEGINGCLYYNYYSASGKPIPSSNNSVANCVNTFEGGTGCAYYQYYSPLATATTPTTKTNCLPRYAERSKKSPQAGIPDGCFVVDKGTRGKEYNCTAIDGCYYYLDGRVDCTYKEVTATACTTNAECAAASTLPLMIPVCDVAAGLCEYQGNGCLYEPNPKGAIACPGATSPATGGDNFVQCMLNPDSVLPGFLNTANNALSSCSVNADCPLDNICLNGTCYPQCQANIDCASGEQCTTTCTTSLDCTGNLVCNAGFCVPPQCAGGTPSGTLWNVTTANLGLTTSTDSNCRYSTNSVDPYTAMTSFATTDTTSHSELLSGLTGGSYAYYVLCQELSSSVLASLCQINFGIEATTCTPGTTCASGLPCTTEGVCPPPPVCFGATPKTPPNLLAGTTSTTIGLITGTAQTCKYGDSWTTPYDDMALFDTIDGTTHSKSGVPSKDGPNVYYARCYDVALDKYAWPCFIPFNQGCSSATVGATCITTGGTTGTCGTSTTGESGCFPLCLNPIPVTPPNLLAGTTSTTIGLDTDTVQTCKYDITWKTAYDDMDLFDITDGTTHSEPGVPSKDGPNAYYARCHDVALDKYAPVCIIPFDQGCSSTTIGKDCVAPGGTTGTCIPSSTTGLATCEAVCADAYPSGSENVGDTVPFGLQTGNDSTCRYASVWTKYDSMTNSFTTTDGVNHSATTVVVAGKNTKFVGCRESAAPSPTAYCWIPFSGGPCTPGTPGACEIGFGCSVLTGICDPCSTIDPPPSECNTSCDLGDTCCLFPMHPLCVPPPPPPGTSFCALHPGDPACINSCNTLGYTFTGTAVTPSGNCDLVAIILALLSWMAWLIALLAVLSGLRAAYLYITAMGNENNLILAKRYLIYTTIGVGVSVLTFSIVAITRVILNI